MANSGETYRAGLPKLGARLLAAAGLVRAGGVVADIGCDHGKLSVYLALRGRAERVIAVDARPMPLEKARALAAQTGCQNVVDCRLGSGLSVLAPSEAQDIVMAGLSGETMAGIVEQAPWVRDEKVRLVLLPSQRAERLRAFLCRNGFEIFEEVPVLERGRAYSAMLAGYTGKAEEPTALFCLLGLVPQAGNEAARAYAAARLSSLKKQAQAKMDETARAAHEKLVREVETCLL